MRLSGIALLCLLTAPAQSFVVPGARAPARPTALQQLRQPARASPVQLAEKKPAGGLSVPFFLDVRAAHPVTAWRTKPCVSPRETK